MESAGLFLLRAADCIRIPEVLAVGDYENTSYLIMEWLDIGRRICPFLDRLW